MLTTNQLRRVRRMRSDNPTLPLKTAVEIVRYEDSEPTEFEFLTNMDVYPTQQTIVGEVNGLEVEVKVGYDPESHIGEDDVTGTFTDTYEDGAIKNTARNWGSDYKYYVPSNSRFGDGDWTWYHKREGMSKSVARDHWRSLIEQDMREDAERAYLTIDVTVSLDGRDLGGGSLCSIDVGTDPSKSRAYLIEVANDLINEALGEVPANIDRAIERATSNRDQLIAIRDQLVKQ